MIRKNAPTMSNVCNVVLTSETATVPQKQTRGSAGYDLYASESAVIPPNSQSLVSTGVTMALPDNAYGQIAARSGLSMKGIFVGAGVIDSDYRGELKVLLRNFGEEPLVIEVGHRIAQLLIIPVLSPTMQLSDTLDSTERGEGGFGSTGISGD